MNVRLLTGSFLVSTVLAACGGDTTPGSGSDAGSGHSIASGSYASAPGGVTNLSDGCGVGATAGDIEAAARTVAYAPTTRTLSITSAQGTPLGTGTVTNNTGTLTYSATLSDGTCSFTSTRTVMVVVTADDTLQIQYSDARSSYVSAPGNVCQPPASTPCTIAYTQLLTAQ
jgi:hypothetical protein